MKKILVATLVFLFSLCLSTSALAQNKEIRVLLANHPYGDLLKAAIPDFEKATGIRVKFENLQESQLTTKLATEFATRSSSVDVFMTRPLQEGKMFYKNGWIRAAHHGLLRLSEECHERRLPSGGKPTLFRW